jgi:hypothetical protein
MLFNSSLASYYYRGALTPHVREGTGQIHRRRCLSRFMKYPVPMKHAALGEIGVDHIGVLVGDGSFPRERSVAHHRQTAMPIFELLYRRCVSRSVEAL